MCVKKKGPERSIKLSDCKTFQNYELKLADILIHRGRIHIEQSNLETVITIAYLIGRNVEKNSQ